MKPANILIVDDEPVSRRLLTTILSPLDYQLTEVGDGQSALSVLNHTLPDLILLDVVMPGMDGYEVCRRLKENPRTKLIPVIMLTSLDRSTARLNGLEIGVDEFLAKPFNIAELKARVRSLIALKRYTDELEKASDVLEAIAKVVEKRDAYTGHHCKRVGDYGAAIAIAFGLGADTVKAIRLAGMFHDLGKVSIPDHILRKPGPLNEDEKEIMQSHAATGALLMQPMQTMAEIVPLIRHHHERLDGSGYPDGLSADEIPLPVRIVSVVDIYDALATQRPYKPALLPEECLSILFEEVARGWWDRDVVNALAAVVRNDDHPPTSPSAASLESPPIR